MTQAQSPPAHASRIRALRVLALACAAVLLLLGPIWTYWIALLGLAAGALGLHLLRRASRLQPASPPAAVGGEPFGRVVWWLLVAGFGVSLAALLLVR